MFFTWELDQCFQGLQGCNVRNLVSSAIRVLGMSQNPFSLFSHATSVSILASARLRASPSTIFCLMPRI